MQKLGMSKDEANRILESSYTFEVGDKVKINYEKIMGYKSAIGFSEKYKKFVSENKDKIFTLDRDNKHKSLFVFKEDESDVKWLWYGGDLIKVDEEECNDEQSDKV